MTTTATVVGDGPAAALHALAIEDAGLQRVARDGDLLVVAASASERVGLALTGLDRGVPVLVDPPLSPDEFALLVDADAGRGLLRLSDHRRFAPAWQTAVRHSPTGATHVSLLIARPAGDGEGEDPVSLFGPAALSTVEAFAGDVTDASIVRDTNSTATVEVTTASGATAQLRLELGGTTAVWHAQAAGAHHVVAVELSPEVLVEYNGDPIEVPRRHETRDDRLEHLGFIDQVLAVVSGTGAEPAADLRRLRLLADASQ